MNGISVFDSSGAHNFLQICLVRFMWANGVQFMRNQYLVVYLVLYPVTSKGQKITPPPFKKY